ncbi:lamin tail domain-containing protein [Persicimonas caeni]|uniref:Lamin tail domain-containing protein n=1 Tax=Persicimonas caeni TaxID=2292766 RepID=A0A4Y6PQY7_PERCE|nr:lamin tail domain-containing protein [Persicimonas caeni]QDG50660.1 lamin tail domain-containing protein [Persicimonas caeni]QED31881.1 lamin tail domain-containing protein [Persicimonas caeni]
MSNVVPTLAVLLLGLVASGCNLAVDVDEYPYRGRGDAFLVEDTTDTTDITDTSVQDGGDTSDTADTIDPQDITDEKPPSGKPFLIFTELMPDSSMPPDESTEYGEFIEVKNIGTAPADPRRIIIQLGGSERRIQVDPFPSDDAEREVFDNLQWIEPGEYFVFVREDRDYYKLTAELEAGTFYEYGRWFDAVPLSNSSRRLQLSYKAAEFHLVEHDAIEWAGGRLIDPTGESIETLGSQEDVAWGLHRDFEDAQENNDPTNWCFHVTPLTDSPVMASPGRPTPTDCVGEE